MSSGLLLLVLAAQVPLSPPVHGRVSADGSAEPIAGVLVEEVGGAARTVSDSLGDYTLRGLAAGSRRIRFSRFGYRSRAMDVVVRGSAPLRLDVTLPRNPLAMPRLDASPHGERRADVSTGAELGLRRYGAGDILAAGLASRPDPLALLTSSPDVRAGRAAGSVLRVRGGSADQNMVLLDGAPIYAPFHGGDAMTAVDPDALAGLVLHEGVAPARLGGTLSSVIEMQSRSPTKTLETSVATDVFAARALVSGPLPGGGGFLVSGQRGLRDLFAAIQGETTTRAAFDDVLGTLDAPLGGGTLEALVYGASNAAGFDALPDAPPGGDGTFVRPPAAPRNSLRWASNTSALRWRRPLAGGILRLSAWRAALDADFRWLRAGAGEEAMRNGVTELGGRAALDLPLGGGSVDAGIEARRLETRYTVAGPASSALSFPGAAVLGSAFLEDRARLGRWSMAAGLRGTASPSLGARLAPRISADYAPRSWLTLGLGYARTLQFTQSLRNEESVLNAISGVTLPVAADGERIPVATGTEWTTSLGLRLPAGLDLQGDAYLRHLAGLLLVPAASGGPFAVGPAPVGRGRAVGATVRLGAVRGPLELHAGYGGGISTRSAPGNDYRLSIPSRTLDVSLALRAGAASWLVGAFEWADGRVTSPLEGGFIWTPDDPLDDVSQISGSPRIPEGALNSGRLPQYARLDLGLRREWRLWLPGRGEQRLGAYVDVRNVLGRANQLGLSTWPDGTSHALLLLPRSLAVGISLRPASWLDQARRSRSAVASR